MRSTRWTGFVARQARAQAAVAAGPTFPRKPYDDCGSGVPQSSHGFGPTARRFASVIVFSRLCLAVFVSRNFCDSTLICDVCRLCIVMSRRSVSIIFGSSPGSQRLIAPAICAE